MQATADVDRICGCSYDPVVSSSRRQIVLAVLVGIAMLALVVEGGLLLSGRGDRRAALVAASLGPPTPTAPPLTAPPPPTAPPPTSPPPTSPLPTASGSAGATPPSVPAVPVPPLDSASLRRAPVPALCGNDAGRLRDGELRSPPGVRVSMGDSVRGDLDGDGADEAAAVLSCSADNSVDTEVVVYARGPRLVGRVPVEEGLGGEVRQHAVRILKGRLEVSGRFLQDGDARCCPTGMVARQYRLSAGRIVRLPATGVDRRTRLTDGDGWSTVRVGDDYEQLARATGLPVTVQTLDDRDVSSAQCTYVSLAGAGDVGVVGGRGRVRAVVFGSPGVLTGVGPGVGTSEQRVLAAYGAKVSRVDNVYSPVDDVVLSAGAGRIVRFEFSQARVVSQIHAGETDYASLVEGCA